MKQERNQLLKDCDYCAWPDFPNRDKWLVYRRQLRNLPANLILDKPFPQPPT
jgi:hypothetical protein